MTTKLFFTVVEYVSRSSVFLVLAIIVGQLSNYNCKYFIPECIDATNQAWMLLAITFMFGYFINKYWDAAKQ